MSPMTGKPFIIDEVDDPVLAVCCREQDARAKLNSDWLSSHWSDVLPGARGRCVAVAGQEAFIADTPEQALALAKHAHPDDDGVLAQYVYDKVGPRIYGNRR
ncbi:MAG TPA: hypothetical protein VGX76_12810 [Pirellulales bacterium]|nr:hypothetical protein [Pirellulales bacterium]